MNCDGVVDNGDSEGFTLALTATPPGYEEYYAEYPGCDVLRADINQDGEIDNGDIDGFVALLFGGSSGVAVAYEWDAENRLVAAGPSAAVSPAAGMMKAAYQYDYMNRRIERSVWTHNGSTWGSPAVTRYVWNDWLTVAELDGDNAPRKKYTWGRDLAGVNGGVVSASSRSALGAAGGIGGLLSVYDTLGAGSTGDDLSYVYFYDANGNVGQLVDPAESTGSAALKAHYQYDPYGKALVATGPYAVPNPIRFSTKPWDNETGMGYWGERYYDSRMGRWVSRDPIGERGGRHLYVYAGNGPTHRVDYIGRLSLAPWWHYMNPRGRCSVSDKPWPPPQVTDLAAVLDCDDSITPLTREKADELLNTAQYPRLGRHMNRGCIGLAAGLQGANVLYPEQARNTSCFLTEKEAEGCACPDGSKPFVFAKQGQWNRDFSTPVVQGKDVGEPTADPLTGEIPGACIKTGYPFPGFNYVTVITTATGKKCYLWMDHDISAGQQSLLRSCVPFQSSWYPHTIWCRTCP